MRIEPRVLPKLFDRLRVPRPVFLWLPRRGIMAGPLAGRRMPFTRATEGYDLAPDGRYFLLPSGAPSPYGRSRTATTTYTPYPITLQGWTLTNVTNNAGAEGPISGKNCRNIRETTANGEHWFSAVAPATISANNEIGACLLVKAAGRSNFEVRVTFSGKTIWARLQFDANGMPSLHSQQNIGEYRIRLRAGGWWSIGLGFVSDSTANAPTLRIQLFDDSWNSSYVGDTAAGLDVAYACIHTAGNNNDLEFVPIDAAGSTMTRNSDILLDTSPIWNGITARPLSALFVLNTPTYKTPSGGAGNTKYMLTFRNGSNDNNSVALAIFSSTLEFYSRICNASGGAGYQATISPPSWVGPNATVSVGASFAPNRCASSYCGQTSWTTPTSFASYDTLRLSIGAMDGGGLQSAAPIHLVALWNEALSPAALSRLTAAMARRTL